MKDLEGVTTMLLLFRLKVAGLEVQLLKLLLLIVFKLFLMGEFYNEHIYC